MAKYDGTKFYWLQLKEDFFDEDAIDWLEDQPNGKEYSLFYIKLCLKSLKTNGVLIRRVGNMLIPYDHVKLGELTNTNPDTVMVAMNLLMQIGLVQKLENGELYLTQVENMIGSQSKSAFKKQQQRLTRKTNILIEGGQEVDNCPPKIEEEIEQDEEIEEEEDKEKKKNAKRFSKPTIQEIEEYCNKRNNGIDAHYFYDYYESNGWVVGKHKMKDWKATIRNWERRNNTKQQQTTSNEFSDVAEKIQERAKANNNINEEDFNNLNF